MKRVLSMLLVLVMLLSLCACSKDNMQSNDAGNTPTPCDHSYKDATCTDPKICTKCGATEGSAAEHSWNAATCSAPKTCSKCGATEGSAAEHSWNAATCAAPKTCSKCGATEGSAAGHSWKKATCTVAKTCSKCGATEGSAAGHKYNNGACTVCGAADPNVPFTNNEWIAYIVKAGTSEQGEVLSEYVLKPTQFQGYTHKEYYSNASYSSMNNGSITYGGKTYYDYWFSSSMNGITWEDKGDTVTVTFAYDEPVIELVLTRTGEAQFTVSSSNNAASIPVGTVFNKD